ncbi:MAG: hypothetical protein BWK76_03390 [Desulfobulbaceae bacterium A2]|nr:MAG: hypothetical protein BWK76_03390 [Desulfobulbaceae bacterium A2]
MSEQQSKKRHVVHVSTPDTACGYVGHMTVDELKEVAAGADFEVNCPVCGAIHLSREEIEAIEKEKFTDTEAYKATVRQAQALDE